MVLARIHAGETVDHYETRRRRKDGAELPISLTVSPIIDDAASSSARRRSRATSPSVRACSRRRGEQAPITAKLNEVGAWSRPRSIASDRPEGHRRRDRVDRRGVRRVLLQRARPRSPATPTCSYTLSGAPKEAFAKFPASARDRHLRADVSRRRRVRLDDVTQDPRYGQNAPYLRHAARDTCRSAVISPCRSKRRPAKCSAACSSVTRGRACSPSSTSSWRTGSPRGPRWRWRMPGCIRKRAKPTG